MREPLSDKIISTQRGTARGKRSKAPLEREVRLDGARSSAEVIRERIDGGFYHTPGIVEIVARRIVARGDL